MISQCMQLQAKAAPSQILSFTPIRTNLLQRKCTCGGSPGVDGECAECRKKRLSLQDRSTNQTASSTVPPVVHNVLRSPGQALDPGTRAFMEPRFGHDFSQVRVHTDAQAAESARAVNALAYTVGQDVVFGAGQHSPETSAGKRLLAHELAHTIQHGSDMRRLPAVLETTNPGDSAEKEAQAAANAVMQGQSFAPALLKTPQIAREVPVPASAPPTMAPAAPTPTAVRTVKVWLNAFIPDTVPGKTLAALGPHVGETMLKGPIFSDCYLTDNRSFDSKIYAPSRMHSEIKIDVAGPTPVFQWHNCSPTHEIDCTTGAPVCTKSGRTSGMSFSSLRGSSTSLIQVNLKGASNNPCYSGSPDIDYGGTITIDVSRRTVEFDGKIDQFPAFEMYATANDGAGVTMFSTLPLKGKDPWNLAGAADRAQKGKATI